MQLKKQIQNFNKIKNFLLFFILFFWCSPSWATLTVVSVSATNSVTSGDITITAPTSISDGNLLLAGMACENNSTMTSPAGWSDAVSRFISSTSSITVFQKTASSESGDYTFSGGCAFKSGGIINIHSDSSAPSIDVAGTAQGGTGTTATALSITTTVNNTLVFYFSGSDGAGSIGVPSGYTDDGTVTPVVFEGYSSGHIAQSTAGATGNKTATASSPWTAVLLSVKDSGSPPPPPASCGSCIMLMQF